MLSSSRGQGNFQGLEASRPRPKTCRGGVEDSRLEAKVKAKDTKKSEAKDSLSEDRHSLGQEQECSRPRTKDTSANALPPNKRSSQKFFRRAPQKHVFHKIFQALYKILTIQEIVLSSSRGQANFRGLEASRPRPRTSKSVLEDVLEAKDVLEDSTSEDLTFGAAAKVFKMCPPGHPRGQGRPQGLQLCSFWLLYSGWTEVI